jgi:crotonobetainyl-CoA:carnitine CoA-transferase CaiB-like acyl-CoA transferase
MEQLAPVFAERTTQQWLADLEEAGIPCAPVNTMREAFNDEQLLANDMLRRVEHPDLGLVTQLSAPYQTDGRHLPIRLPPPRLGEHTHSVLSEVLGLGAGDLAALSADRVI